MFPIQLILGIALIILMGLYIRFFKQKPIRQAMFGLIVGLGILLVALPDLTTQVANYLGVGRGVDLIFYLVIILAGFGFLHIYAQLKKMSEGLAEVVRQQAIEQVKTPSSEGNHHA